jgi:hypothetical protein
VDGAKLKVSISDAAVCAGLRAIVHARPPGPDKRPAPCMQGQGQAAGQPPFQAQARGGGHLDFRPPASYKPAQHDKPGRFNPKPGHAAPEQSQHAAPRAYVERAAA